MPELNGQLGELHMTLQITRAETGKTETVELIGFLDADKLKELQHGSDTLDSGTERSN